MKAFLAGLFLISVTTAAAAAQLGSGESQVMTQCDSGTTVTYGDEISKLNALLLQPQTIGGVSITPPYSASAPILYSCGNYCFCVAVTVTEK